MICGSCILYHTDNSEHALRKMLSLPITPESLYLQKAVILILGLLFLLILESSALVFCTAHWFTITEDFWILLFKKCTLQRVSFSPQYPAHAADRFCLPEYVGVPGNRRHFPFSGILPDRRAISSQTLSLHHTLSDTGSDRRRGSFLHRRRCCRNPHPGDNRCYFYS